MGNIVPCRVCGNMFDDDNGFVLMGPIKAKAGPVAAMRPQYDFDTKACLRKYVCPEAGARHPTLDSDFP